ncbi:hypothetical protein AB1Y20_014610 [Prymnesium parvum]|uniref:Uncharacterized protein n=1 Tax=Prymnesium parvum TaxID=97485 RepID=A0AB34IE33_PRYPA
MEAQRRRRGEKEKGRRGRKAARLQRDEGGAAPPPPSPPPPPPASGASHWREAERSVEVALRPMEALSFVGSLELAVLDGAVRVLGAELAPSDPARPAWHALESPAGGIPLSLQSPAAVCRPVRLLLRDAAAAGRGEAAAPPAEEAEARGRGESLEGGGGSTRGGGWFAGEAMEEEEALPLEEAAEEAAEEAEEAAAAPPSARPPAGFALVEEKLGAKLLPLLPSAGRPGALLPAEWEAAADALAAEAAAPAVLLCGARNQGKSSFARFLLNRLLHERGGEVAFLECDVGQPEFSPPGMAALHLIAQPVLGGPTQHMLPLWKGRFVGAVAPNIEPEVYVKSVLQLLEEYREGWGAAPRPPLLINTCGWVSGLGLQMLADIVAAASPTHLVVLDKSPAMPSLPLHSLGVGPGYSLQPEVLYLPGLPSSPAARSWSTLISSAPPASESRALRLLAYFSALPAGVRTLPGAIDGYERPAWQLAISALLRRPPLCVPLRRLTIRFPPSACHAEYPSDAVLLELLNGRLVGLLRSPRSGAPTEECACEGLAIVRSVDAAAGLLYLLTPVAEERMVGIDALALGALELPVAMLLPTACTGPSPYITADALRSAGAGAMQSRNNIVRQTGDRGPNL